jgi:hypothetical protein
MAVIKSGVTSDQLTIDATSKAARVTPYDVLGNYRGVKRTYRAASIIPYVPAVTADRTIFTIGGSATTVVTVKRIIVTGSTLTAVAYITINAVRYSTATTGGTSTNLPQVALDTNNAAGTAAQVRTYTAVATDGTLVGTIASQRVLMQATTAAAAGMVHEPMIFNFGDMDDIQGMVLRGTSQECALVFPVAPATTPTIAVMVEWTEE